MECRLDLTVADSRLWLRSRAITEDELAWGPGNRAQGALLLDGLVLLDPLADEEFGADVIVRTPARFSPDKRAQRTLQLPFSVIDAAELAVASPADEEALVLDAVPGDYTLFFEVCVGRDVFYTLTLLPGKCAAAQAVKADGWGLKKGQPLLTGVF